MKRFGSVPKVNVTCRLSQVSLEKDDGFPRRAVAPPRHVNMPAGCRPHNLSHVGGTADSTVWAVIHAFWNMRQRIPGLNQRIRKVQRATV
jgi:hypothetical protein